MKILKLILCAGLALSSQVWAQRDSTIHILHMSATGGLIEMQNRVLQERLEAQGYRTEFHRINNCKEGENWLKNNPDKSAMYNFTVDEEANRIVNGDRDSNCNIGFKRERVLTIVYTTPMNVCSMMPPDQAEARFMSGNFAMGNTAIPSMNTTMAQGVVNSLKLKNARVIMFKGNPALIQALISGDIQFAFFSNVKPALAAGAQCWLTTAGPVKARELGRKSLADLDPRNPWIDAGQMYVYMGNNVDFKRMRELTVDAVLTHPEIVKNLSVGYSRSGIPAGMTEEQQWRTIQAHIRRFQEQKGR